MVVDTLVTEGIGDAAAIHGVAGRDLRLLAQRGLPAARETAAP